MTPAPREVSVEELLKHPTNDILRLRDLGITDFAIIAYVVRVQDGRPRNQALNGLLQGRSLTEQEKQFVCDALNRLPVSGAR